MIYLVALLGLLYADVMVLYDINRLCAQEQDNLHRTLAEHHNVMQQNYYGQFRIQQEETRALWHDISKLIRAAHEKIEVNLDVSVPIELFVAAVDLYILLRNTLDNAIEACSAVSNSERRIYIQ